MKLKVVASKVIKKEVCQMFVKQKCVVIYFILNLNNFVFDYVLGNRRQHVECSCLTVDVIGWRSQWESFIGMPAWGLDLFPGEICVVRWQKGREEYGCYWRRSFGIYILQLTKTSHWKIMLSL